MTLLMKNLQNELIIALALVLLGAGIENNVSEPTNVITIDSDFDSYQDKTTEVNTLMQDVVANPDNYDLGAVQDTLFYDYYPWAERHPDARLGAFTAYLEACNQVVISLSKGQQVDTTEMNLLYNELVPTTKEIHKEPLKISNSYPFLWLTNSIVPMNP